MKENERTPRQLPGQYPTTLRFMQRFRSLREICFSAVADLARFAVVFSTAKVDGACIRCAKGQAA